MRVKKVKKSQKKNVYQKNKHFYHSVMIQFDFIGRQIFRVFSFYFFAFLCSVLCCALIKYSSFFRFFFSFIISFDASVFERSESDMSITLIISDKKKCVCIFFFVSFRLMIWFMAHSKSFRRLCTAMEFFMIQKENQNHEIVTIKTKNQSQHLKTELYLYKLISKMRSGDEEEKK